MFFYLILLSFFVTVLSVYDDILGCGKWTVLSFTTCPDADQYKVKLTCGKKKMNHTHDSFYGQVDSELDFDNRIGVYLEIYKESDGGSYKLYMTVKEECMCCKMKEFAPEDLELALSMMGIDPPDCPVQAGHYELSDFVFNYERLKQKKWMYGKFKVIAYITTGLEDKMERIGCLQTHFDYSPVYDAEC